MNPFSTGVSFCDAARKPVWQKENPQKKQKARSQETEPDCQKHRNQAKAIDIDCCFEMLKKTILHSRMEMQKPSRNKQTLFPLF